MSTTTTTTTSSSSSSADFDISKSTEKWMMSLNEATEALAVQLKRGHLNGSGKCATATADLLRISIQRGRYQSIEELIAVVSSIGSKLIAAQPLELAIGNMVRRVLFLVRNEYRIALEEVKTGRSARVTPSPSTTSLSSSFSTPSSSSNAINNALASLTIDTSSSASSSISKGSSADTASLSLSQTLSRTQSLTSSAMPSLATLLELGLQETPTNKLSDSKAFVQSIKTAVVDEISELTEDIKNVSDNIREQAVEHVYANEVILTYARSKTVVAFLKEAAQFRQFTVIVAESSPDNVGHEQAVELAKAGISTTVIPDSAVFAMMSHVNKVIIGTHAVMANGGLLAFSGAYNIALAAKHHSVPVVVLCGLHKLSPLYAYDQDTFNTQTNPSSIMQFGDALGSSVHFATPKYDYVPPELVALFVTNIGGHDPSYVYRLLQEYYNPKDYEL